MNKTLISAYRFALYLLLSVVFMGLLSCQDEIDINLKNGPSQLSVDGWLTNQTGPQVIKLTRTTGYFDASLPPAATGATVTVTDDKGKIYTFTDTKNSGNYTWTPATATETFGEIGRKYTLNIQYQNDTYQAVSQMNRVPAVDSITFVKEKLNPVSSEEGYLAEFFSTDIEGEGNFYWIRAYQNGKRLDRTSDIVLSYNGGFGTNNADTDGLLFILPVRFSINPEKLYQEADEVKVEVLSITPDAFNFFQQLSTQINNGGLFATPPANIPTNVINLNESGAKAVGYFGVSALSSKTVKVDQTTIRASR
ncbi:DUF4249 domain-containing protein [Tellurirhabdus bombi]|uniref:DUF4249 domain-containing protein n=1 Tax=Tellurirhabdus bombi TaxID=2907205 RepID=UPI001F345643|nr:DUF4249 domain-containing protein [Tellurirhabdus bombi]